MGDVRDGSNHTENGVRDVVALKEPEELEEGDHSDDTSEMGDTSHHGSKVAAAATEDGTGEEGDDEENHEEDGVEDDGTDRDDRESEEGVDRGRLERLHIDTSQYRLRERERRWN
jgi:hypothetical protein